MSAVDEIRVGDVRFQMGWNVPQARGRLVTFCDVRLEQQRVLVRDVHDLATGSRTAQVPDFLRTVAEGLVEREEAIDEYPRSMDVLEWLQDAVKECGPDLPYTAFQGDPNAHSFGVQTIFHRIDMMIEQLGVRPDEVGTVGDLIRRFEAAMTSRFDFDRQVTRAGQTEFAWHPGERRTDGGFAIWLRVRHGRQEVYGQRRFGAGGQRRGPDHESQLADGLEKGVLMALEGGLALMEVARLADHLARWRERDGELTGFERAAMEHADESFLDRWAAAELRNSLHQFGDMLAHDASLADVARALEVRARRARG